MHKHHHSLQSLSQADTQLETEEAARAKMQQEADALAKADL